MLILLALTFVHGMAYLVIVPAWQHYDEPTHFEYAALIAQSGRLPKADDYDALMRQEIASSMQATGFWKGTTPLPIEFWSEEPAWLGSSELDHPPLYYLSAAIPLFLASHQAVETQLYLARLVSLLLNLVVVTSAFVVTAELFPQRRWFPLGVAAFLAWLPPLTDLMSGVSNDAGSAAAASLLLAASVRLVRRGPSLRRWIAVAGVAGICIATKNTAGIAAIAVLLTLIVCHVPRRHRRWLWIGLGALVPLGLAVTMTWSSHAAHWYSTWPSAAANRAATEAPHGRSALVVSAQGDRWAHRIVQELQQKAAIGLRERTVTIGAWLKVAEGSDGFVTLFADDGLRQVYHRVTATQQWQFHAFRVSISPQAGGVAAGAFIPGREGAARSAYLDGFIMAEGSLPLHTPPAFDGLQARSAQWGTGQVTNLLKNGSAERPWPSLKPWLGSRSVFGQPLASAFHSLLDWSRTKWAYAPEIAGLVSSFWGTFGWNHLRLPEPILIGLGVISGLALLGISLRLVGWLRSSSKGETWRRRAWLLVICTLLVSWAGAFIRIHPMWTTQRIVWPTARYAVAAAVPTAIVLCLGLASLVPRRWLRGLSWAALLGMAILDATALLTLIVPYYYG